MVRQEDLNVPQHVVYRYVNWKRASNGEQVTFNEASVPCSYTFGSNVCGDYVRINGENYIVSSVENLYTHLKKLFGS
jgi:hypothetical protein